MQIIPVIDLKDGLVVHAVRGDRANYAAIHRHSVLTGSSNLDAVLAGFLQLYPFRRFYIADLDAITDSGNHHAMIQEVAGKHPQVEFWLDNGSQLPATGDGQTNVKWVIGTESQRLPPRLSNRDFILSLDYKDQKPAGLAEWFDQTEYWPQTIIVMTLNRVGSNSGPDFEKLAELRQSHPDKNIVAAGGVRNIRDLSTLKKNGVHSALIATALHSGSISAQDIQKL